MKHDEAGNATEDSMGTGTIGRMDIAPSSKSVLVGANGQALSLVPPTPAIVDDGLITMFERLARDPNVDVEKIERLIAMQERILARNANAAFDAAFVEMRPNIPVIVERAHTDKTTYAPLEDIVEVVTPILSRYGFSLGFETHWPSDKTVTVVGILTHCQGHARRSEFQSAADKTGSKNDIQALASAISYGKRYTTNDLLCIVTRAEDDDGERSQAAPKPTAPEGFTAWWAVLAGLADEGFPALETAWGRSRAEFKNYVSRFQRDEWKALKTRALQVKR